MLGVLEYCTDQYVYYSLLQSKSTYINDIPLTLWPTAVTSFLFVSTVLFVTSWKSFKLILNTKESPNHVT